MKKLVIILLTIALLANVSGIVNAELIVITDNSEQVVRDTATNYYWYRDLSALANQSYDDQLVNIANLQYFGIADWHLATWGDMNTLWSYSGEQIATAFIPTTNDCWQGRFQGVSYGGEILAGRVLKHIGWYEKTDLDYIKTRPQSIYPHVGAWIVATSPPKNHPPVLDPISDKIGFENELLEFQITATDPDPNDVLSFSASNLPSGAVFDPNTATFSWVPNFDQAENYPNVEFTVTDNGNPIELDTELITINIGNVNRAPVFTQVGSQTVDEGALLEFLVEAVDPDNNNIVLSQTNKPDSATFDPSTGLFTWTPDYLQEGTYTVTFTATDDGEPIESSEMGVPITVGNTPNPIQLTDDLVYTIENSGLPNNVINSYLANLKKVTVFIEKGKIEPAINQLFAFICKVEEDLAIDEIDQAIGDQYLFRANEIIEDLGVDPALLICQ